ncbi:MAG: hypothetical protein KGN76_11690 [Acidobacteriota bacterium]|nr:hypothetical protein [Acidobacteriota bacterium]
MSTIDRLHAWATRQPVLRVLTLTTRVLLALAFFSSGLVKIRNQPFTSLPISDPVGFFFAGFFSAHGYYQFVGLAQWLAAGLLLIPRTATLGAFLCLPIVVNIFAITNAIGPSFGLTRVIAGGMLLADLYLLFWDWDRWKRILPAVRPAEGRHGHLLTALGLWVAAWLGLLSATRLNLARLHHLPYAGQVALFVAAGLLGLTMLAVAYRRARQAA